MTRPYTLGDWSQHPSPRPLTPMPALDACGCGGHDQAASCAAVQRAKRDGARREHVGTLKLFGRKEI